ncbi:MAG: DUF2723 domain-containing protein [Caldilinea sp.]|nr:DUF2723 domain-containing protein [Caldilinea sp.]
MQTTKTIPPLTAADAVAAVVVGAAALALYLRTLVPYPLPGDSGEFQVLVHQLGAAHTTGYSTYLLLGHLFEQLVPWGDVAWRVNLFSAVMGALAAALVYLAGKLLTGSGPAAVVGALSLSVGFTFWSQAIIAEVYTTGAAFLAAVLFCVLLWERTDSRWAIGVAGMLGGVGLGAHGSLAPLGLAVALFLLLNARRWRTWLLPALAGAIIGLALYAGGMFLVDANQAPANIFNAAYTASRSKWGLSAADVENPATRVWFLASAGQWCSALFTDPGADTWPGILDYLGKLPRDVAWPAIGLALLGLGVLLRREWKVATFLFVALLLQLVIYVNYGVGDRYVFFIPTYVLWSLLVTAGAAGVLDFVGRWSWGKRAAMQAGLAAVLALLCVGPLVAPRWPAIRAGSTPFTGAREYLVRPDTVSISRIAPLVTAALEPNAIVFTEWHWLYPYYYAAHIEQAKTGIQFIETSPRSEQRGLASSLFEFVHANIAERPIYTTGQEGDFARAGYRVTRVTVGPTTMYRIEAPE